MEHLRLRGAARDADLFAGHRRAQGCRASRAGDWLYFVTIDAQGTTLFTRDYQQHLANIELAKHNGVLDSARSTRKAAVLGSPIAHSRSPQLHLAAYRALGLADWTYERIECDADELPGVVGGFGPEWVGVSVTMPGKFAALRFADERTERAELVGAGQHVATHAGGLAGRQHRHRRSLGRPGLRRLATGTAVVSGSGGTAPAAIVALAELGVTDITVVARNADKAAGLVELAAPGRRRGPVLRPGQRRAHRRGRGGERAGQHACLPMSRRVMPRSSPVRRCCWTRSTTRGRRRWLPR